MHARIPPSFPHRGGCTRGARAAQPASCQEGALQYSCGKLRGGKPAVGDFPAVTTLSCCHLPNPCNAGLQSIRAVFPAPRSINDMMHFRCGPAPAAITAPANLHLLLHTLTLSNKQSTLPPRPPKNAV